MHIVDVPLIDLSVQLSAVTKPASAEPKALLQSCVSGFRIRFCTVSLPAHRGQIVGVVVVFAPTQT